MSLGRDSIASAKERTCLDEGIKSNATSIEARELLYHMARDNHEMAALSSDK